jgi:hypothetical protein
MRIEPIADVIHDLLSDPAHEVVPPVRGRAFQDRDEHERRRQKKTELHIFSENDLVQHRLYQVGLR